MPPLSAFAPPPNMTLRTLTGWLCLFALSLTLGTLFAYYL
jgi:hypothetical protein